MASSESLCRLENADGVYVITMTGMGEHRLNPMNMNALASALETVHNSQDAVAVVLTNEGKFFSNGMDIDWVRKEDSNTRRLLLGERFDHLLATCLNMNVPTIAAICGHVVAGGAVLAYACDYRYMKKDHGFLYFSELDAGVEFSSAVLNIVQCKLKGSQIRDAILEARKYTASSAYEGGFIDSVHENASETLKAAIQKGADLGKRKWSKALYERMRQGVFPIAENFKDKRKTVIGWSSL